MRLFVGIPLPDETRAEIAAVVAQLRRGGEDFRWSASDTWHITLQFLGNGTAEQLECLKTRLGDVHTATVSTRIGALGSSRKSGLCL